MTQKKTGYSQAQDAVAWAADPSRPEPPRSSGADGRPTAGEIDRRDQSDNPLRDLLVQVGQAHLEEQIVRAVGAHLARQQSTIQYAFGRPLEPCRVACPFGSIERPRYSFRER